MENDVLKPIGGGLFYAEAVVKFIGVSLQTRMAVATLPEGGVWICSPLPLTPELGAAIDSLGEVRHILSPNKIHNLGLAGFAERYPEAKVWASPGLPERLPALAFDGVLDNRPDEAWSDILDQRLTDGNVFFSEAVFLHRDSRTLIVADLVENLSDETVPSRTGKLLARMMRIRGRALPSPEFLLYTMDADAARARLEEILAWPFERILLAHGDLIEENAHEVFRGVMEKLESDVSRRPPFRKAFYAAMAKRQ